MQRCAIACVLVVMWLMAEAGATLTVNGTPADISAFLRMLEKCTCTRLGLSADGRTVQVLESFPFEECPGSSRSFRALLERSVSANHNLRKNLGRNQAGIMFDGLHGDGQSTIDLDDVEQIPDRPPGERPNCSSRCQNIAHVLGEANRSATNAIAAAADWPDSHPNPPRPNDPDNGIGAENQHRADLGQSSRLVNGAVPVPGTNSVVYNYDDGTQELWDLDPTGDRILGIRCP